MTNQNILLVVGLGNPGEQYTKTRHNAGFWYIEKLSNQYHIPLKPEAKFHGLAGRGVIDAYEVRLLMPTTFMNRSGHSVNAIAKFYQISSNQILVAHDELDLAAGSVRLKFGGGHGGHNGLRDIHPHFGPDYYRLRIGIGHPGHKDLVTGHVLGKPEANDLKKIDHAVQAAVDEMPLLLQGKFGSVQQKLHAIK